MKPDIASCDAQTTDESKIPRVIEESSEFYGQKLPVNAERLCSCKPNHLSCITAKEWLKCQIGVWQFSYEGRDIRDKKVHPATFPISLARKVIELFTHEGELVLDPFVGSGTTLVAANDTNRNAVGFDLKEEYVRLCGERLGPRLVLVVFSILCESRVRSFLDKTQKCRSRISKLYKDKIN